MVCVVVVLLVLNVISANSHLQGTVQLRGLQVSISTEGQSIAGEEYTLVCSVSPADGESMDDLTVEWLAPNGSVVGSGSGTTQLTHTLNPLLPSNGGEYRCRATLQGGQELLGEDTVNVIVSVPPPEVAIEYEETQNGYILRCYALLIEDTPLLVDGLAVEWLDQYGTLLSSDGKRQVGYTSDGGVYTVEHHQNGCGGFWYGFFIGFVTCFMLGFAVIVTVVLIITYYVRRKQKRQAASTSDGTSTKDGIEMGMCAAYGTGIDQKSCASDDETGIYEVI